MPIRFLLNSFLKQRTLRGTPEVTLSQGNDSSDHSNGNTEVSGGNGGFGIVKIIWELAAIGPQLTPVTYKFELKYTNK